MCLFFQLPVFLFKAVNVFANECDYFSIDGMPVMMGNVFVFSRSSSSMRSVRLFFMVGSS